MTFGNGGDNGENVNIGLVPVLLQRRQCHKIVHLRWDGVGVPGSGGLEYLGEGGWSTWERGVGVPGRGGLEYLGWTYLPARV